MEKIDRMLIVVELSDVEVLSAMFSTFVISIHKRISII